MLINLMRIVGLAVLLLLSACRSEHYIWDEEYPKWPCKLQGACDINVMNSIQSLERQGVKVVTIGQDYMLSIPENLLFEPQTPRLQWKSYSLLNDIAGFLKQFSKIIINITSYSNRYVSLQKEYALTLARSRVVSEYLWSQGVNSRFMFAQGLGNSKPIIAYTQGGDNSANARVEITFRRAVA